MSEIILWTAALLASLYCLAKASEVFLGGAETVGVRSLTAHRRSEPVRVSAVRGIASETSPGSLPLQDSLEGRRELSLGLAGRIVEKSEIEGPDATGENGRKTMHRNVEDGAVE